MLHTLNYEYTKYIYVLLYTALFKKLALNLYFVHIFTFLTNVLCIKKVKELYVTSLYLMQFIF